MSAVLKRGHTTPFRIINNFMSNNFIFVNHVDTGAQHTKQHHALASLIVRDVAHELHHVHSFLLFDSLFHCTDAINSSIHTH